MGNLTFEPSTGNLMKVSDQFAQNSNGDLALGTWRRIDAPPPNVDNSMRWGRSFGWVDSSVNASEAMGMAYNNARYGTEQWDEIGTYPIYIWWPWTGIFVDSGTGWGEFQFFCWTVNMTFVRYPLPSDVRAADIKKIKIWWGFGGGGTRVRFTESGAYNFAPLYDSDIVFRAKFFDDEDFLPRDIISNYHASISCNSITDSGKKSPQSDYTPYYKVTKPDGDAPHGYYLRTNRVTTVSSSVHSMFSNSYVWVAYFPAYISDYTAPATSDTFPHAIDSFGILPPSLLVLI